ncbi:MAG TPA: pyridoxamine 5'-phosphate oxidase family protein [Terracidiphilus sp.]|nr:pyridoxamine 5'-phosphate oxidase family protein [Terracidiphilus sp.]
MERIAALLKEENTLALATTDEAGQPCVAPLFYIVDEDLSLFWLSSEASLHSENLNRNPGAAVTVYTHTAKWREIRGVQMRGAVSVIADPKHRRAIIRTYCQRFQLRSIFRLAISRCALFVFRPEFIRFIDNSRRFGTRIELERCSNNDWRSAVGMAAAEQLPAGRSARPSRGIVDLNLNE